MTTPFQFPNIQQGSTIMDPGTGGAIASGLAQVLAAQQQQKENEFRLQQLQEQQAQQQALAQYYQATTSIQSRQQASSEAETQAKIGAARQVGGAMQAALGVGQPTGQPSAQPAQQGAFSQVLSGGAQAVAPGYQQIFQGVAPENMGAAVEGVGKIKDLTKPEELPTAAKEFEFVKHLAAMDPTGQTAKFFIDHWVTKPGVTVNNIPGKVETAYGVEGAKADVAERSEALKQVNLASASFPSMNEAYRLMQSGNVVAGLGSKQVLGIHRVLAAMGNDTSKLKATDTQTATKLLRDGVLAQLATRALGSGTAVSDADRNYMESVQGADLSLQPDAIRKILRINVGLSIEKIVSAKMLLEQQQQSHPEAGKDLAIKIKGIETKMAPIWKKYQDMLAEEAKAQAQTQLKVGPAANSLFPVRSP